MGCGVGLLRVFLVLVNVVFGLLALVFLAVGVLLRVGSDVYESQADDVLDSLPSLISQVSIGDAELVPEDGLSFNLEEVVNPVAIAFIVLGVVLLLVCIFGCLGACCGLKICMIVYAVILIVVFLVELILVILFFTGTLSDEIKSTLNDTIVEDYGGIDSWNHQSVAWNFVMIEYECCGLDGADDFLYATEWKRQRVFTSNGVNRTLLLATPVACCKLEGDFPDVEVTDEDCAVAPTNNTSNGQTGCWDAVSDDLEDLQDTAVGACAGVLAFQALLIVISIIVFAALNKEKNIIV